MHHGLYMLTMASTSMTMSKPASTGGRHRNESQMHCQTAVYDNEPGILLGLFQGYQYELSVEAMPGMPQQHIQPRICL